MLIDVRYLFLNKYMQYYSITVPDTSDILLRAQMKTMKNEECAERVPESERNNVKPFHLCAEGRFGADEATGLEDDSCQVIYSI